VIPVLRESSNAKIIIEELDFMSDKSKININLGGLSLTLIFMVLKLSGCVTWPWWVVLCPVWIPMVTIFLLLAIAIMIAVLSEVL